MAATPVSISLSGPLVETRFVERPNRFIVRCAPPSDGAVHEPHSPYNDAMPGLYEAHMADPGRLRELLVPGRRVWLRRAPDQAATRPPRRTEWSAVLVESPDGTGLVSVDTSLPNRLIRRALELDALDEFAGWHLERCEATLGASRIDFVLADGAGRRLALEVKSVTLVEDGVARFPDAVTARGARHVAELAQIAQSADWSAAILFVLQRPDASRIEAAASIDPVFAAALAAAKAAGVAVLGRRCDVSLESLTLAGRVPAG